mmetsp:Transcript_13276/g.28173  ORF Transcript_13276/g.28173 Transcript_13276/m.28173 type:complete len:244 (+) Transcript_13276:239-970(+)
MPIALCSLSSCISLFLCSQCQFFLSFFYLVLGTIHGVVTIVGSSTLANDLVGDKIFAHIRFSLHLRQKCSRLVAIHFAKFSPFLAAVFIGSNDAAVFTFTLAIDSYHERIQRFQLRRNSQATIHKNHRKTHLLQQTETEGPRFEVPLIQIMSLQFLRHNVFDEAIKCSLGCPLGHWCILNCQLLLFHYGSSRSTNTHIFRSAEYEEAQNPQSIQTMLTVGLPMIHNGEVEESIFQLCCIRFEA